MVKKVLIVNYEPKRLSRLNELIVDLGYESMTAKNGIEALDIVEEFVPDLAIIDPMLPKLSGFEVAQKLTSEHPGLPIIMVTSVYKGNRYRTEAISKYGVKEYLEEPFEDETLQTLVKKYMELSEPPAKPKKKASARRRLEEILEETMSGKMPGGKSISHKKKTSEEPVLTSSDIFSDVIKDVEEAPGDLGAIAELEKAKEAKETHKEEPVVEVSPKPMEEPKPKPELDQGPEVKKREVEVKSETPEPRRTKAEAEDKSKKKGKNEGIEYGSYVLLEKVATGGMAELFKAKRRGVQGFQKIVAIKRILSHLVDNEEFVTMFIDEAKLAAQLNHPNIAQIYDLGKIENSFYIAMEYVEGYDLRNVLKECKKKKIRIPEPLVLFIASKMLSALDYAHRKKGLDMKDLKIVHRDISPQNILISKGGDVKLVDFGIAKAATKASHTQAGALKGKLLYMSPEQAYGKPIDNRSDLFSLASVIYESITGKKCFLADSEISILEKVRKVQYTPIQEVNEDVSKGTERLIRQAFSKKIENRFQSAKEMESELHGLMESLPFAVNERILAQFVNALYQGDMNTIEEISRRYTVNEEVEPEEVEVPTPKSEQEAAAALTLDDLNEDVDVNATVKMDSGTMIMPDLEDVEKHEDELIEQFGGGSGGNKTGLIVAIVVVVIILGVIGYFAMMRKPAPARQVTRKPQTQTATEPESPTSTVVQGETATPTAGQEAEGEGVAGSQTNASTTSSAVLGIDREKLVQQLLEKKLAEEEAKLKKQKKMKKSTPKPVKKTVVAEKKTVSTTPAAVEAAKPEVKAVESKVADTGKTTTKKPASGNETAAKETTGITTNEPATVEPESVVEKPVLEPVVKKPVEIKPIPQPIIPKTKEGDLVALIEGEVVFPTPVKTVRARSSVIDRRRNLHGEVLVQGLIDENGNVVAGEVRVLQNSVKVRNNFGKAAIRAFSKWKFTPAMKDGVRVKVYFTHTFVF
ncbi:MAG: TonB family protein [Acidobacteria bacterium]|nr:TonB family protein [Acidobacteriota bacterium]